MNPLVRLAFALPAIAAAYFAPQLPAQNSVQIHPQGEFIFAIGSASFPESHASTVVALKNGDLMAAWFGGTKERNPDVAIWGSRRAGGKWSAPIELEREKNIPCWNPVLFHTADGRLWLYYKVGASPSDWAAGRRYSDDEGQTWSSDERLPAGLLGPIRAKPLVLPDGTIVSGTSVEAYNTWAAWIERSTDNGKTWTKIGPIDITREQDAAEKPAPDPPQGAPSWAGDRGPRKFLGIIQPSVILLGVRHLRLYARSRSLASKIAVADSLDNGLTWTQARFIDIPNNNSGIDAVTLKDGRIVLIYNDTTVGRTPLNLAVSADGEHFTMFATLEDTAGQYSYPALIQVPDGSLNMTYTWQRKTIKYVNLPLAAIPQP
jgi:predicted neuraminidase